MCSKNNLGMSRHRRMTEIGGYTPNRQQARPGLIDILMDTLCVIGILAIAFLVCWLPRNKGALARRRLFLLLYIACYNFLMSKYRLLSLLTLVFAILVVPILGLFIGPVPQHISNTVFFIGIPLILIASLYFAYLSHKNNEPDARATRVTVFVCTIILVCILFGYIYSLGIPQG